ncbi:OmpA family protein [Halomonas sp. ML-15]|uniref:OmpA family protein n=1 Tax=Halomonas sp. ML-15 TaxID=2773305 RepID=UPI001747D1C3|nr:OmpA family protein [Halomonas sp. ML-15]MBD3895512.1 OmpA family protein [Halomonas sp. ML-15]
MDAKRISGLVLVLLAILLAAALSFVGRDQQSRSFTVDFQQGRTLAEDSDTDIARIATLMSRQPRYEALIVGHSGTRGDASANLELSRARAEIVSRRLIDEGIDSDRLLIHAVGRGEPLEQRDGESERRYQQRLARVEVELEYR